MFIGGNRSHMPACNIPYPIPNPQTRHVRHRAKWEGFPLPTCPLYQKLMEQVKTYVVPFIMLILSLFPRTLPNEEGHEHRGSFKFFPLESKKDVAKKKKKKDVSTCDLRQMSVVIVVWRAWLTLQKVMLKKRMTSRSLLTDSQNQKRTMKGQFQCVSSKHRASVETSA